MLKERCLCLESMGRCQIQCFKIQAIWRGERLANIKALLHRDTMSIKRPYRWDFVDDAVGRFGRLKQVIPNVNRSHVED